MWDAIWEAGRDHGLTPLGLEALDILRIESGLIFAGYEFDGEVDPFEAGSGSRSTCARKTTSSGVRRSRSAAHPQRTLVGLELEGTRPQAMGTRCTGRRKVGVVTSGTRSLILKKNVALARVAIQVRGPGERSRGRQARRSPEADPRDGRPLPVLRPRQDPPAVLIDSLTSEQIEAFRRDGFLIVEEGLVSNRGLELLRERYEPLFDGQYETGIRPDEVNWVPGRDPEDRTRQLCNAWKSDTVVAAQVLSERMGRLAARLADYRGVRILQDNVLLEAARNEGDRLPPGLLLRRLPRPAGDDHLLDLATRRGRMQARSSSCADRTPGRRQRPRARSSTRPTTGSPDRARPPRRDRARPRAGRREAGGGSFHHGLTWHGSAPNRSGTIARMALVSHLLPVETRFHETNVDLNYSRYCRRGDLSMDESFFPVVWTESGYRTPWLAELPDLDG